MGVAAYNLGDGASYLLVTIFVLSRTTNKIRAKNSFQNGSSIT